MKLLPGAEHTCGPVKSACPKFRDDAREQVSWPGKQGEGALEQSNFENLAGHTIGVDEPGGH